MSTASLHCGMVCCARGWWFHAPSSPGDSGTTRAHYDARALAAVRRLCGWHFSHVPQTKSAAEDSTQKPKSPASGAFASRHTSTPYRVELKLRHSPPLFSSVAPAMKE